ncbi:MAG: DUF1573 domain-containing protein [Planctomycetaceae bacterium]|jgi:hypothetical protein|nr:DUF1573 domain-containing protein [Planctomycetaceae bacterium]
MLLVGDFTTAIDTYNYDAGKIYYIPKVENKLSHTFHVVNPFRTNMKLSLSGKTCSCVLTNIVEYEIPPHHSIDIIVSFNFDELMQDREEIVTFATNQKDLPYIKLIVKAETIPTMSLNDLHYYLPSLSKNEESDFLLDAVFYVDSAKTAERVKFSVEGSGFELINDKPLIKKVGDKFKVTVKSRLLVKNSNLVSFTSSRMPGKLVLQKMILG